MSSNSKELVSAASHGAGEGWIPVPTATCLSTTYEAHPPLVSGQSQNGCENFAGRVGGFPRIDGSGRDISATRNVGVEDLHRFVDRVTGHRRNLTGVTQAKAICTIPVRRKSRL